ncbi:MAG TPA: HAD hydrolase-like protein [Candidatus Polarisedimenticolaceae bacterium]|nr:HAD hydrolase-like protein [Candidatus Polarisedimenticolaceae bacterium]
MAWIREAIGALVDIDGTLVDVGRGAVPGAAAFLDRLHARALPYKICSNTSRRSRADVVRALADDGLRVRAGDIVLPALLARRTILDSGAHRAQLLVPEACVADFAGIEAVEEGGDWVVVGDLGRGFTADRLDPAFRALRDGARLLALHRNLSWYAGPERGWVLDAGAYVAALEQASGAAAIVVGKPARAFFDLALADLGLPAADVVMIGDSIENDCVGAAAAGCRTCVVRGTAFRAETLAASPVRPDVVVDSVDDLTP